VAFGLVFAGAAQATPTWLTPETLSETGQDAAYPQIAVDGSGNAIVVWYRSDGSKNRVQAAVRPASTGVWSTLADLSDAEEDAEHPQVAFDGSGNAIAIWQRYDGSRNRVQASVRPVGTGVWSTPETLSTAGRNAEYPQVAFDGSGNAIAVWIRSDGSKYRVQTSVRPVGTGVWSTPAWLSDAGRNAHYPQVAVDESGNAIAIWYRSDGSKNRVQASVRPVGTGVWGAPDTLSAEGEYAEFPQVAFDGSGNAIVVWRRLDGSKYRVQASVRPVGTGVWSTPADLSTEGRHAYAPQVAVDGSGNAIAIWYRGDGSHNRVQVAVRPASTGLWGAPTDLSAAGQNADDPQVAVDGSGNAIATWVRFDGSKWRVQTAARPVWRWRCRSLRLMRSLGSCR
jgi:hypothetical protein